MERLRGRAQIGRRRAAATVAHLEQSHFAREIRELAREVGERLFGGAVGVLPDDAPSVGLADRHGAVVVDAPPRLGVRGSRGAVGRLGIRLPRPGKRRWGAVRPARLPW